MDTDCLGMMPDLSYRDASEQPAQVAFHKSFGRSLLAGSLADICYL
jgi:hypothetical protein